MKKSLVKFLGTDNQGAPFLKVWCQASDGLERLSKGNMLTHHYESAL